MDMYELEIFNKHPGRVIAAIVLFVICMGILGNADMQEEISNHEWYCSNVDIWVASSGENGHPNFKGIDCEA
jgi:hypothetical protein